MATTPRQIISGALRLINVIQSNETPSPDDMAIALSAFDAMLNSWSNDRLMVYTINPHEFDLTSGKSQYILGNTGVVDWSIERPMNIEQAYVRLNSGTPQSVDIPVVELNDAQFSSIAVKNTPSTFPFNFYDNGDFPNRTITLWPVPTTPNKIVLWLHQPLVDFTSLDTAVQYPPGYERAFRFNLAVELAAEFGKDISPQVLSTSAIAKKEIARLNAVPQYISCDGGTNAARRSFSYITGGLVQGSRV